MSTAARAFREHPPRRRGRRSPAGKRVPPWRAAAWVGAVLWSCLLLGFAIVHAPAASALEPGAVQEVLYAASPRGVAGALVIAGIALLRVARRRSWR